MTGTVRVGVFVPGPLVPLELSANYISLTPASCFGTVIFPDTCNTMFHLANVCVCVSVCVTILPLYFIM